jgi:hypothetical protein
VQEETSLPVGWLRLQESGQGGGGAEPYSYLILGVYCSPTCSRGHPVATWRRGGGGFDVADERRPQRDLPPGQRPVTDEEFRRRLERETDLSLREDPERQRFYQSGDLPHSRSSSDDRPAAARRHHRDDVLTWNGETLTLIEWSQRTGIRVETLLRRCRKGWSVEQVLTTPPGGGKVTHPPT